MGRFSKNAFHVDPELSFSRQFCEPGPGAISQRAVGERGAGCSNHGERHGTRTEPRAQEAPSWPPQSSGPLPVRLSSEGLA